MNEGHRARRTLPWRPIGRELDHEEKGWHFAIMVKTQIQIPDRLFKEAKQLAEESEMSFAQVVRLGLELVLKVRPLGRKPAKGWQVPQGKAMGLPLISEQQWTEAAHEDQL
jgi:hypothetical protein